MVFEWSKMWGMKFNIDKSKFMTITKNKNIISYNYSINGQLINRVFNFCDLGLEVNSKFTWCNHISNYCGKANRKLGYTFLYQKKTWI